MTTVATAAAPVVKTVATTAAPVVKTVATTAAPVVTTVAEHHAPVVTTVARHRGAGCDDRGQHRGAGRQHRDGHRGAGRDDGGWHRGAGRQDGDGTRRRRSQAGARPGRSRWPCLRPAPAQGTTSAPAPRRVATSGTAGGQARPVASLHRLARAHPAGDRGAHSARAPHDLARDPAPRSASSGPHPPSRPRRHRDCPAAVIAGRRLTPPLPRCGPRAGPGPGRWWTGHVRPRASAAGAARRSASTPAAVSTPAATTPEAGGSAAGSAAGSGGGAGAPGGAALFELIAAEDGSRAVRRPATADAFPRLTGARAAARAARLAPLSDHPHRGSMSEPGVRLCPADPRRNFDDTSSPGVDGMSSAWSRRQSGLTPATTDGRGGLLCALWPAVASAHGPEEIAPRPSRSSHITTHLARRGSAARRRPAARQRGAHAAWLGGGSPAAAGAAPSRVRARPGRWPIRPADRQRRSSGSRQTTPCASTGSSDQRPGGCCAPRRCCRWARGWAALTVRRRSLVCSAC